MLKIIILAIFCISLLPLFNTSIYGDDYYVISYIAKVKNAPDAYAKPVMRLLRGQKVPISGDPIYKDNYIGFRIKSNSNKYYYVLKSDVILKSEYQSEKHKVEKDILNAFVPNTGISEFADKNNSPNNGLKSFGQDDSDSESESAGVKNLAEGSTQKNDDPDKDYTNTETASIKGLNSKQKRLLGIKRSYKYLKQFDKDIYTYYPEITYKIFRQKGKIGEYKKLFERDVVEE